MNRTPVKETYNRYRNELKKLIDGHEAESRSTSETWKLVCQRYKDDGGRALLVDGFEDVTGLKINTETNADQRIAVALPKSVSDQKKKVTDKSYYRALGELFIEEMESVVRRAESVR